MRSRVGLTGSIAVLMLASIVTACAPGEVVPGKPTAAEPMVQVAAAAELPAKADGKRYAGDPQADAVRNAVGRLGVDLLRDIRGHGPKADVAVSPFSVYSALALTQGGARGDTSAEMRRTLHADAIDPAAADRVYADYLAWIPTAATETDPDKRGDGLTLRTANAIWLHPGLAVKQPFLDRSRDWYGAEIAVLDMGSAGAPAIINGWVSKQTGGKIPKIIDDLPLATKAVLANAVYLKGSWSEPFREELTRDAAFALADGSRVDVPTMQGSIGEGGRYRETDVYEATDRGMLGGAMYIYLPRPGKTPDDVLAALARERAAAKPVAWERDRLGQLYLPRFKLAWDGSLADPLERLGMPLAFSESADFSGLAGTPGDLFIGGVVHAATTEVDERGIEAAAATVVAMTSAAFGTSKPPVEMRVDRPFVYEVVSGDMPLFIGVVEDPR